MGLRARKYPRQGSAIAIAIVLTGLATNALAQRRIMPLGDSITDVGTFSDRYVVPLWELLADDGYPGVFVGSQVAMRPGLTIRHEGHGGFSADQILDNVEEWAAAAWPDIVLLHVGHNDHRFGQSPESTLEEIGEIVATLRKVNPRVAVILAQIIPAEDGRTNPFGDPHDLFISELNAGVPLVAAAKSTPTSPVTVVSFPTFDANVHTRDGIHPNEEGEMIMAEEWFAALQKMEPLFKLSVAEIVPWSVGLLVLLIGRRRLAR